MAQSGCGENGRLSYPEESTPRNIYFHYVLEEWFLEVIQPWGKGCSQLIRFADDFLRLFSPHFSQATDGGRDHFQFCLHAFGERSTRINFAATTIL